MDRELLVEIGTEEMPASWLPGLTRQMGDCFAARLAEFRLPPGAPVEPYSTPRRLAVKIDKVAERQTDFEETITGPPVSAAFKPDGEATPAAVGFARKHGVEVGDLTRSETPKGTYLAFVRKHRSKAAVDVLPDVFGGVLRDLTFPKQMRWDAWLDDGKGELLFGRPIRWILLLYGGRVVPFTIRRSESAQSPRVQDVRSGAVTYGHRFLATSGRAGRAVKVRSFDDYNHRLAEHFVVLEREERHNRIGRELDVHARRLGGRVSPSAGTHSVLLQEVPDLVEYPSVIAGAFPVEFLDLPSEVLTTTMIHHQHFFPVVNDTGALLPAFLAVTNTQPDNARVIARNAERVLTARLRDARFFWQEDRAQPLESQLVRLETLQFHAKIGSYRQKAERLETLAERIARDMLKRPDAAAHARTAGRLAKADLTTGMVREFTELQGTMGGIYARAEGQPEEVWKAIYYHYLPIGVEPNSPPSRADLGAAAVTWAAVSLADKLDTIVHFVVEGESLGSRDPFGLRRAGNGVVKILLDLPDLTGLDAKPTLNDLFRETGIGPNADIVPNVTLHFRTFWEDRLTHALQQRGFDIRNIRAVTRHNLFDSSLSDLRRKLEVLPQFTASDEFLQLARAFKRVRNLGDELSDVAFDSAEHQDPDLRNMLSEPAELALFDELERRQPVIEQAMATGDFRRAFTEAAAFGPAVDKFFDDVLVMSEDETLRTARLRLLRRLSRLILRLADVSEIVSKEADSGQRR